MRTALSGKVILNIISNSHADLLFRRGGGERMNETSKINIWNDNVSETNISLCNVYANNMICTISGSTVTPTSFEMPPNSIHCIHS